MILPLEQQVCSLESAKSIKEFGVKQESLFYWNDYFGSFKLNDRCWLNSEGCKESYSAFTASELGELLPKGFYTIFNISSNRWDCCYIGLDDNYIELFEKTNTECESRAKMLIYLLENNLTTLESVNVID